jgi:hypothetical protein
MTRDKHALEKALRGIEHAARDSSRPPHGPGHARTSFYASAATGEDVWVHLFDEGAWAFEEARHRLAGDLRFEHMDEKAITAALETFAATAAVNRGESHIRAFVEEHAHEIFDLTCSFTVEDLELDRRRELFGATFIPAGEVEIPPLFGYNAGPVDSVIAVPARGTSSLGMMERAKEAAEHALRLLRAGLREHRSISSDQLRFRLGNHHWFTVVGEERPGWKRRAGEPIKFGPLNDELIELATSPAIATLPEHGSNDVEERANRALVWWERSFLSTDPIEKVVFLFSALESILGDRDGGLKAHNLTMRRAALSESLKEGFAVPKRGLELYEDFRSKAIHGEQPHPITPREAEAFEWDIRKAISEYLRYARANDLTKRKQVRASLQAKRREIEDFLDGLGQ